MQQTTVCVVFKVVVYTIFASGVQMQFISMAVFIYPLMGSVRHVHFGNIN